ncbi:MAG: SDR family NAD(P)-dependent oxidoreductase [Gammaproteobacteria bacterium]
MSNRETIKAIWSKIFNQTEFSPQDTFSLLGGNSQLADKLFLLLEDAFGQALGISTTVAYDYPIMDKQIDYIERLIQGKKERIKKHHHSFKREPIAIIGMACRFPGGANTPEDYWQALFEGKDVLEEIPISRWDINKYYDPNRKKPGKMVARKGGFITDHDKFDAKFFHISPKEAEFLDPNQRIALETTWHALEDARIKPETLSGTSTGVFMGVMFHDYEVLLEKGGLSERSSAYLNLGTSEGAVAGRISYSLGLQGPSMVLDTACSSSLVALHEACQHIRLGECDLALAGGVNLMLLPEVSVSFSQANMLSPDSCCKSFSDDANGYVRSEGCGVVVLKRLSQAIKDGDKILAVIKGSAVNQDGASSGMTVPNRLAQQDLLEEALAMANLSSNDIDYIEAHGTGTPLGDPIEMGAIEQVYQGRDRVLYIGSVKSNIGHLEAASGMAGVMKVILSLQHEYIPANLHFRALNPRIHLDNIPAQIPVEPIAWKKKSDKLRRAGISSFGFTGTNAHVIIEEAEIKPAMLQAANAIDKYVTPSTFILSAKTSRALEAYVQSYIDFLKRNPQISIDDICYTLQISRELFTHALLLEVNSTQELLEKLEQHDFTTLTKDRVIALTQDRPKLESVHYQKINLPTYPFEKKYLWFKASGNISVPEGEPLMPSESHLILNIPGNLSSLSFTPFTLPALKADEICIEVKCASLNFRDILHALDEYQGLQGQMGLECSGIVQAVGEEVEVFKPGDAVYGIALGSFASAVITKAALVLPKPPQLIFEEAATLPMAYWTAYESLIQQAQLKASERVLIHAAAGGVGLAAVHVAKALGAQIYATAGNKEKRSYLASLGVMHIYDSRSVDFSAAIIKDTEGEGVAVVLNSLTSPCFIEATLACTAQNARFIEIGRRHIFSVEKMHELRPDVDYHIIDFDNAITLGENNVSKTLLAVHQEIEANHYPPLRYDCFSADELVEAFRYMQQAKHIGKIVISQLWQSRRLHAELTEAESAATPVISLESQDAIKTYVRTQLAEVLGLPLEELEDDKGFMEMGFDSLLAVELSRRLKNLAGEGVELVANTIYDYPTVNRLTDYLSGLKPVTAAVISIPRTLEQDIAIVGMSCRFPGHSNSPEAFWDFLMQQGDGIVPISKERAALVGCSSDTPWVAGFIDNPELFDPQFFGISPREAEQMDPQQRLLLMVSWEALENAGYYPKHLQETKTAVLIGAGWVEYEQLRSSTPTTKEDESYSVLALSGNLLSALAGRLSYSLGLQGPALTIDTACSSSLVAISNACDSLRSQQCDMALAGGVSLDLSYPRVEQFNQAHILSPTNSCKTFDAAADGYVRGEGCGILVLKRLSDAQKAGDRILAVIKASCVNQDGASSGFNAPNGVAQERLMQETIARASIDANDVDYIETHGTGTRLGDPIETHALMSVYGQQREIPLILGAVKTNIGHTEMASGVASLIKVILALNHQIIPPNIHFHELNPEIKLNENVLIAQEGKAWPKTDKPRLAAVSAFGLTGTNAHVILEEPPVQDESQLRPVLPKTVFHCQPYWVHVLMHKKKRDVLGEEVHPLLGVCLPETVNQAIIYEQSLELNDEDLSYLQDHKIYDHVVYPAAAYIELLISALRMQGNGNIALKNLTIERPLVPTSSSTKIQLMLDKDQLSIYSKNSEGWGLYSQCIRDESPYLYEAAESLSALEARVNKNVDVASFYAKVKAAGIDYGPKFQVIQCAKMTDNEVLVYLKSPLFDKRYAAYPALLDGGLQAIGLLAQDGIYLPIGCENVLWYQSFTAEMVAHIHLLAKEKNQALVKADIDFYSGETCIMRLKGFEAKRASKAAMFQGRHWYYEIQWNKYEPIRQETSKAATVYDARHQDEPAIGLLSYLQNQLTESPNTAGLYIITENAYGNPINLPQSSLNGFIKTAILEHPELNIAQLDVTQGQNIEPLIEILNHGIGNAQILKYKEGEWYNQTVVRQTGLQLPTGEYRLVKDDSGLLEKLELIEEDILTPNDDEIIIEPRAVGLNFRDVLNAMNLYPGDPGPLGGDVSGIIKSIGKNISEYQVGDEVFGLCVGGLASQTISKPGLIIHKPKQMTFAEAASIPTIFMTAYLALIKLAKLKANETILIHAGAGGVGLAAIQIAQYLKAKIICTAGSDEKRKYLQSLGVKQVYDSRDTTFKDDIKNVDVVLNSLSGKGFIEAGLQCCAKNARFIEIGKRDIWSEQDVKNFRSDIDYHILALDQMDTEKPLAEVMSLFSSKILKPVLKTEFALTQAKEAFKYLQQAKQIGKVVITLPPAHIRFKEDAYYLITGGSGGIGLEVAHYLSEHDAKHIILASRHAPNLHTIAALKQQGVDIIVAQCDISQEKQVKALIKKYPIKGIFHTAGIIEDAPLDKQTQASFEHVFAGKAKGAWYLHEASKKLDLDYFVLFSSIASMNGFLAQSNYAAANSFLDGLAQYRQQQGLQAISINWGPWKEVGMAKDLVSIHARQGLKPLSNQEALEALTYALKQPCSQLGVVSANWELYSESLAQTPPWLEALIEKKPGSSFIQSLQNAPLEQREERY